MKSWLRLCLSLPLLTGGIGGIASAQPADKPERIRANAVDTARKVCLVPESGAVGDRENPCAKALILLQQAGLQDSLVFAEVQTALGLLKAERGAQDAAIDHFQYAVAYRDSIFARSGDGDAPLAVLEVGTSEYCDRSLPARRAITLAQLRSAWAKLNMQGRELAGISVSDDDQNGGPDLETFSVAARRVMARTGYFFPQVNRPLDMPMLVDRLVTKSVPAFGAGDEEYKMALMESFLSAHRDNGPLGARFIKTLGQLEEMASSGDDERPNTDLAAAQKAFATAFAAFIPALRETIFSSDLESALKRKLPEVCSASQPSSPSTR